MITWRDIKNALKDIPDDVLEEVAVVEVDHVGLLSLHRLKRISFNNRVEGRFYPILLRD
jgi:hypothetical protein